jgi:hypothetical protein
MMQSCSSRDLFISNDAFNCKYTTFIEIHRKIRLVSYVLLNNLVELIKFEISLLYFNSSIHLVQMSTHCCRTIASCGKQICSNYNIFFFYFPRDTIAREHGLFAFYSFSEWTQRYNFWINKVSVIVVLSDY